MRPSRKFQWFFVPFLITILILPAVLYANQYMVTRVVDGDTFEVKKGSTRITIRLVGIDTPEVSNRLHQVGQPFSLEAEQHLSKLILGKTVDVKTYGADRNGRTLGEVFLGDRNINLEMVKAGLAEVYRGTPAKGQDLTPFWNAEEEARTAGRGMWVLGDKYVSPRQWRKEVREKNG